MIMNVGRSYLAFVLYLVGPQFLCIVGKPLDQVTRDHIARAAGKRRVGWTRVLQLLPLPNAIHCPALPETGSGWQRHHHQIQSPFQVTYQLFNRAQRSHFFAPKLS